MQIASLQYDEDTGILDIRLDTGEEYRIAQPVHALAIRDKISIGGQISDAQRWWLEQYRVEIRETNRGKLRERLKTLREEIRGGAER